MKKYLLPILALLGVATTAQAQVRLSAGPRVGYNPSTIGYKSGGIAITNTSYTSGFKTGIAAEIGFGHWF